MQRSEIEKKMKGRGKYNTIVIKKMCDGGKNLRVINNMLNTLNLLIILVHVKDMKYFK